MNSKIISKSLFFVAVAAVLMVLVPNVFAGGARSDWSDHYDNIPGTPECWQDGYDDGLDHPFDGDRHRECIFDIPKEVSDFNQPYYEAFVHGCIDAGNTKDICKKFTD
jgi:hypothetical protein